MPIIRIAAVVVCVLLAAAPAHAAYLVQRDRSDNTHYATWDATSGAITEQYSAAFYRRGDRVQFLAYLRHTGSDTEGERVVGRIVLRVNRDRTPFEPVRYDGTFTFRVVDTVTSQQAATFALPASFILRRTTGEHVQRLATPMFDLPSGSYEVTARFRSGG